MQTAPYDPKISPVKLDNRFYRERQPLIQVKWSNWFFGFSWGYRSFSIALGPVAFSWGSPWLS